MAKRFVSILTILFYLCLFCEFSRQDDNEYCYGDECRLNQYYIDDTADINSDSDATKSEFLHRMRLKYWSEPAQPQPRDDEHSRTPKEYWTNEPKEDPYSAFRLDELNNEAICDTEDVFILLQVLSATKNFEIRNAIRKSWGSMKSIFGKEVRLVFFVGAVAELKDVVENEWIVHRDVIAGSYADSYPNMTLKSVQAIRWTTHFCPQAEFIVRTNDDIALNMFKVVHLLKDRESTANFFGKVNSRSHVLHGGKWMYESLIPNEYEFYSPYTYGTCTTFSRDVHMAMYHMSKRTHLMFPDDIFVAILAEKAGFVPEDYPLWYHDLQTFDDPVSAWREGYYVYICVHLKSREKTPEMIEEIWHDMKTR